MNAKLNWLYYWHVKHRAEKLFIALVWKLPRKVVYWGVVRAAVAVEPDKNPSAVTAEQMLKKMEY